MITPELLQYIREQLALGHTADRIKPMLFAQGWSESDVVTAFEQSNLTISTPSQSVTPQIRSDQSLTLKNILDFKHMKWYEWVAFIPTLFMIVKGGMVGAGIGLFGWGVIFHIIRNTAYSKSIKTLLVVGVIISCFVIQTILATLALSLIGGLDS